MARGVKAVICTRPEKGRATKTQSGRKNRVQTEALAEGAVEVLDVVRHKETGDVAGFQVYRRGDEPFVTTQLSSVSISLSY